MAFSLALRSLPSVHAAMQHYPHLVYCLTPFRLEPLALGRRPGRPHLERAFPRALAAMGRGGGRSRHTLPRDRHGRNPLGEFRAGPDGGVRLQRRRHGGRRVRLLCFDAVRRAGPGAAFLRSPALVELGRLSYGIYVIHRRSHSRPALVQSALMPRIGGVAASLVVTFIGSAASYFLAIGSWHLIEQPFLRLKSRFPYRPAPELKVAV